MTAMPVAGPTVQLLQSQIRRMESRSLTVSLNAVVEHLQTLAGMTAEQKAEVDTYDRQARVWNAEVARQQAEREARLQARKNAREVAAVRAAACPRCFATHAGEC